MDKTRNIEEYLRCTEVMYSAIKARKFDIFEKELKQRKDILDRILEDNTNNHDMDDISKLVHRLKELEELISNEIFDFKSEIEDGNTENKKKMNSIKKANSVVNKYKMNNLGNYSSSFIDHKK